MKTVLFTISLIFGLNTYADSYEPSHYCTKPSKPYEFTEQYEVDQYNSAVQTYKYCIQEFVDEQETAIRNHSNARNSAIEEWNSFANYGY